MKISNNFMMISMCLICTFSFGQFCNEAQLTAGFSSDLNCEMMVCSMDAYCCETQWDATCAANADTLIECLACLNTVSVDQSKMDELLFYPNPTNSVLFIESTLVGQVNVYDLSGKLLISKPIEGASCHLFIDQLDKGTYTLELTNGANSYKKRFVVY